MSDTKETQERSRPVLYRLIDKDGDVAGMSPDPKWLARQARVCWPDQEQDEDRTGKGWDIEAVR